MNAPRDNKKNGTRAAIYSALTPLEITSLRTPKTTVPVTVKVVYICHYIDGLFRPFASAGFCVSRKASLEQPFHPRRYTL